MVLAVTALLIYRKKAHKMWVHTHLLTHNVCYCADLYLYVFFKSREGKSSNENVHVEGAAYLTDVLRHKEVPQHFISPYTDDRGK